MKKQEAKALRKEIAPYEKANTKNSVRQVINTFVPFFILWILAYQSLSISYFLALAICIINAGFLVRIFIIFHDCTHGSFFKNRRVNQILGTVSGVLTLFPYEQWKRSHSIHHATSSNLDKRGTGDVWVMTIDEFLEATPMRKLAYRIYRNPIIMFGVGPIYAFLISNRFNVKDARKKERNNTYLTNILIVGISALLCWTIGWQSFVLIQFPIFFISGSLGIWLFYVQHQFEDSYFENQEEWDYVKAAMDGSSYYKLPKVLQWLTGNIGFHHIHHLSPRVPNYYLEKVHNSNPPLQDVQTITIKTSLRSLHFRLWDEENKHFIGFKDLKAITERRRALRSS
ncbi:fatty acid desaturase [Bacillus sp. FSL K6-3431]|uniref:fatty acid desaturase n=1 Tax=Bacillus sp. FSL K6-3431 TaxID=2921500 RepID=UPI0030F677ED